LKRQTRPGEDDERAEIEQRLGLTPGGKFQKGVEADQEEELGLRSVLLPQQANSVDGVGLARSTDFHI
jgi:hypothetical protein